MLAAELKLSIINEIAGDMKMGGVRRSKSLLWNTEAAEKTGFRR